MQLDRNAPVLPGVIKAKVHRDDKLHMTGKPTELMRLVVRIYEAGGWTLDPFAGSGTTLVAAQMEGFEWTGCEVTEHYGQITLERFAAYPNPKHAWPPKRAAFTALYALDTRELPWSGAT